MLTYCYKGSENLKISANVLFLDITEHILCMGVWGLLVKAFGTKRLGRLELADEHAPFINAHTSVSYFVQCFQGNFRTYRFSN